MPGGSAPLRSSGDIGLLEGAFKTGPWTSAEEQALLALVAQLGAKWSTCSKVLRRSPQSCRHKWNLIVNRLSALNSLLTSVAIVHSMPTESQLAAHPTAAVLGHVDTAHACVAAAAPVGESITVAAAASAVSACRENNQKESATSSLEAEDQSLPQDISAAHESSRPSPAEAMTAASTLGSGSILRTQDNSMLTRSKGKRAAVDGLVDGYLQPLQVFLLGEDHGHLYCLPGGDTLGTLQNGRLMIRESTIEGAGRGLFASASFDEGALVAVYGGELVEYSKQRCTGRNQYCLRISSSDWAVDGHLFSCCLESRVQSGCHWPGQGETARWHQGPACMANNSHAKKNTALKFFPLLHVATGKVVPMLPWVPVLMATRKILSGEEILFNYGCSPGLLMQPSVCFDVAKEGEEIRSAMQMLRSNCSKNNPKLGPGRADFFASLLRGGQQMNSRRCAASSQSAWEICWWHPAYQSFALNPVPLDADLLKAVQSLVPSSTLPTACQTVEDVIAIIAQSSFWDDMVYFTAAGLSKKRRILRTNESRVPSARMRTYSKLLSTKQVGETQLLEMYKYTRAYALLLRPLFKQHNVNHKEFNHIQVRSSFEAFQPFLGEHSDNGIMDDNGIVTSRNGWQAPNSPVVIYMMGDCQMELEFHPVRDSRPGVRIPFGHGWLFVLMPYDDCRCKHSLKLVSPEQINVTKYRISFVLRELVHTAMFDSKTRKIHLG